MVSVSASVPESAGSRRSRNRMIRNACYLLGALLLLLCSVPPPDLSQLLDLSHPHPHGHHHDLVRRENSMADGGGGQKGETEGDIIELENVKVEVNIFVDGDLTAEAVEAVEEVEEVEEVEGMDVVEMKGVEHSVDSVVTATVVADIEGDLKLMDVADMVEVMPVESKVEVNSVGLDSVEVDVDGGFLLREVEEVESNITDDVNVFEKSESFDADDVRMDASDTESVKEEENDVSIEDMIVDIVEIEREMEGSMSFKGFEEEGDIVVKKHVEVEVDKNEDEMIEEDVGLEVYNVDDVDIEVKTCEFIEEELVTVVVEGDKKVEQEEVRGGVVLKRVGMKENPVKEEGVVGLDLDLVAGILVNDVKVDKNVNLDMYVEGENLYVEDQDHVEEIAETGVEVEYSMVDVTIAMQTNVNVKQDRDPSEKLNTNIDNYKVNTVIDASIDMKELESTDVGVEDLYVGGNLEDMRDVQDIERVKMVAVDVEAEQHVNDVQEFTAISRSAFLKIEMNLDSGHVYHFTVNVSDPQLEEVSSTFCFDHATEIGVEEQDMQHGCIDPVLQFLTAQVNTAAPQIELEVNSTLSIDIAYGGSNVNFDIDASNPDSAHNSANIFCTQYGAQFGVTDETLPLCIQNVQDALEQRISVLRETSSDSSSVVVEEVFVEQDVMGAVISDGQGGSDTLSADTNAVGIPFNDQVFVTSFPLGSKEFDYKYVMSVDATTNAATFCHAFWGELEGAFEEAGIRGVDEEKCTVIVSEVTLGKEQQLRENQGK